MSTYSLQSRIWANKIAQGFGLTDVPLELCLLQGELVEFREAERAGDSLGKQQELADVAIFVYSLASMVGVELEDTPLHEPEEIFVPEDFSMSNAVGKFFDGWQHGRESELPDLLKKLMWNCEALAYNHGFDLGAAILNKIELNEKRRYVATAHGHIREE